MGIFKKEELKPMEALAQKVQQPRSRPLLDQIRKDRIAKQIEVSKLEREIHELYAFEQFMETHQETDSMVKYFLDKK